MPISVCQESAQAVFSHTVQVVISQGHICLPRFLCQALDCSFKPSSEPKKGFLCWPKRQLPWKLLSRSFFPICPCMLFLFPDLLQGAVLSNSECVVVAAEISSYLRQLGNILQQSCLSPSQHRNGRNQHCQGKCCPS